LGLEGRLSTHRYGRDLRVTPGHPKSLVEHITSNFGRNEHEVGEGIAQSGVKREEVFVTTKLWNDMCVFDFYSAHAFRKQLADSYLPSRHGSVQEALDQSLKNLKVRMTHHSFPSSRASAFM
jgi:diketogulonate reductase-like aldo/keto reductase